MKEEKLLSIEEMIKLELQKIVHCLSASSLPANLAANLKQDHLSKSLKKTHKYNTRNKHDLYLPKAKAKTYRESFLYKSIAEFNSLPQKVKNITNHKTFIRTCKIV